MFMALKSFGFWPVYRAIVLWRASKSKQTFENNTASDVKNTVRLLWGKQI